MRNQCRHAENPSRLPTFLDIVDHKDTTILQAFGRVVMLVPFQARTCRPPVPILLWWAHHPLFPSEWHRMRLFLPVAFERSRFGLYLYLGRPHLCQRNSACSLVMYRRMDLRRVPRLPRSRPAS